MVGCPLSTRKKDALKNHSHKKILDRSFGFLFANRTWAPSTATATQILDMFVRVSTFPKWVCPRAQRGEKKGIRLWCKSRWHFRFWNVGLCSFRGPPKKVGVLSGFPFVGNLSDGKMVSKGYGFSPEVSGCNWHPSKRVWSHGCLLKLATAKSAACLVREGMRNSRGPCSFFSIIVLFNNWPAFPRGFLKRRIAGKRGGVTL